MNLKDTRNVVSDASEWGNATPTQGGKSVLGRRNVGAVSLESDGARFFDVFIVGGLL